MATTSNIPIVECSQDADIGSATNVIPGTVVKAVYLEFWLLADGQQPSTYTALVEKVPDGGTGISNGFMPIIHTYTNKKNIFELHQGLAGDANANPVPIFRGWVKIPKGKQRFGQGDSLVFSVRSITEGSQLCGMAIFKAYN